ncbi:MAG TPA: universal stress protein [Thermoleophilia bacterium]|nr:universal stress protein [Thermoleophilia bacterium]
MARRKHREGEELNKVLGVPALFSTGYGNVGSSIYYALGVVAAAALGATPLVFILTGFLFVMTAWTYAEATAALPEAGGAASFVRRAFNEFASFGIGWGQMLVYTATIAISALFVPQYLSVFWPVLGEKPFNVIGGILTAILLMAVNVIGIKEASRINIVLALMDLATELIVVTLALVLLLQPTVLIEQIQWGIAPTWRNFLYGLAIGTVAYTGIETISNMAEEAKHPGRDLPRAINMVIVVVLVIYIAMPLAGLSAMPIGNNVVPMDTDRPFHTLPVEVIPGEPEGTYVLADDPETPVYVPVEEVDGVMVIPAQQPAEGDVEIVDDAEYATLYGTRLASNYSDRPVLGVVLSLPNSVAWAKVFLVPWVGVLAATILVAATNAGLIGVSRLTYSFGQHRQLPPMLGRLHAKRMTPYVSIIVFGAVACVLILPGEVGLLVDLYVFGSMISFTAAHVSLIVLRIKEPDLERPWRTPLNVRVKGYLLPVTAMIGGLGTFGAWLVIVWFQSGSRIIGFAWIIAGLIMYVVYRRSKGYSLTKEAPRTIMPVSMKADIDYHNIMVPIVGSRVSDMMMVLACQLATEKQSAIDGLYVIEVPLSLPIDAKLTRERQKADQSLGAAALIASQFKVPFAPHVVAARQAGHAIVKEADGKRSEVIILGTMRKRRIGDEVFGRTIDYVVDHAPCEVLLHIVPSGSLTEGSGSLSVPEREALTFKPVDRGSAGSR